MAARFKVQESDLHVDNGVYLAPQGQRMRLYAAMRIAMRVVTYHNPQLFPLFSTLHITLNPKTGLWILIPGHSFPKPKHPNSVKPWFWTRTAWSPFCHFSLKDSLFRYGHNCSNHFNSLNLVPPKPESIIRSSLTINSNSSPYSSLHPKRNPLLQTLTPTLASKQSPSAVSGLRSHKA